MERKKIRHEDVLSAVFALFLHWFLDKTYESSIQKRKGENVVSLNTVKSYIDFLMDSFLFTECKRWDVKGKRYFDYPNKYYCEDIGL